jgi:hypothetical protein
MQYYHPDPLAEAWRWQICDGEVLQCEARFRAKRRHMSSPLLVEIITNLPLDLEIDEVVRLGDLLEEANPLALMITRKAVFEDWSGIGRACADFFRDGVDTTNSAKKWFQRHPEQEAARQAFLRKPEGYDRYRYRPTDRRNAGYVWVPASIANPCAVVEKCVGDCASFEPASMGSAEDAESLI